MSNKELKLGWIASEQIGVAIINPRGIGSVGLRTPRFYFGDEQGGIEIEPYSILIQGDMASAARAFAEEILRQGPNPMPSDPWIYCSVIKVAWKDGEVSLTLLPQGEGVIDPATWQPFKEAVEKICNRLRAFI